MRWWTWVAGGVLTIAMGTVAAAMPTHALLVLDFELIDEQAGVTAFPDAEARSRMAGRHLRERLAAENLYRVLDPAPIAEAIRAEQARQSLLDCKGCEADLARRLGADRVMLTWVQRVSNLILNLNVEVRDVESGRTLLNKSVDLRGNTDLSWRRGIDFLVRDMVERGQGDR